MSHNQEAFDFSQSSGHHRYRERHDFGDGGREHNVWAEFARECSSMMQELHQLSRLTMQMERNNHNSGCRFLPEMQLTDFGSGYNPHRMHGRGDNGWNNGPRPIDFQPTAPAPVSDSRPIGPAPPGFDAAKWNNPEHRTQKYGVSRNFSRVADQMRAIPDEEGRKRFTEEFLKTQVPVIEAGGFRVLAIKNEKIQLVEGNGQPHWIDTVRDIGGDAAIQWLPV